MWMISVKKNKKKYENINNECQENNSKNNQDIYNRMIHCDCLSKLNKSNDNTTYQRHSKDRQEVLELMCLLLMLIILQRMLLQQ